VSDPGFRIGHGFDAHRFAAGRPLVLGGVRIPHDRGLQGHSDADVLTHAVIDALLGAMGLGDLGTHFPATDPAWKDADSLDLLARACALVSGAGGRPWQVDATVYAERPRLGPHAGAIREGLARAAGLEVARVSVKATTTDGMGFIGRGEGIAASAVALVGVVPSPSGP
jgi:2-C-methyl-D-erythritol 2,4-cyclodiphosphate synthase